MNGLHHITRYFSSYEERETVFRRKVSAIIPRNHAGAALFWRDLASVSFEALHDDAGRVSTFITSNPRDCLVFGTPRQVLQAAAMGLSRGGDDERPSPGDTAGRFGIDTILDQPVRTLSGGENVKVAIAKTWMEAPHSRRLTIASPFSWLSRGNMPLFDHLYERHRHYGTPVELMALEDEDNNTTVHPNAFYGDAPCCGPRFDLETRRARIVLTTSMSPLTTRSTFAAVMDCSTPLTSPCLMKGENGEGKSLVARLLTGAVAHSGEVVLTGVRDGGRARLLFQDIMTQALLRSFSAIRRSTDADAAMPLDSVLRQLRNRFTDHCPSPTAGYRKGESGGKTLVDLKLLLVSVRLCTRPALLVLDEPDWGMTRAMAIGFVAATITTAHAMEVPVMLISHKPWWEGIAASCLAVQKTVSKASGPDEPAFTIRLIPQKEAPNR